MEIGDLFKILISPLVTFIAFYFTHKTSKEQNLVTRKNLAEQSRVSILPFLNIEISPSTRNINDLLKHMIYSVEDNVILFKRVYCIANIGQATAVNVTINFLEPAHGSTVQIGNIGKDKEIKTQISVYMHLDKPRAFRIDFEDLQGRTYFQKFELTPTNNQIQHFDASLERLTPPQLKSN